MTNNTGNKFFAAGVLAGAYAKLTRESVTLSHAVSDAPLKAGRLSRAHGEALCKRSLQLVDECAWEPADKVDCPKCREILARM